MTLIELLTTVCLPLLTLCISERSLVAEPTPSQQAAQLVKRYDEIDQIFEKELEAAKSREAISAANKRNDIARNAWYEEAGKLIRMHPANPAVVPVIEKYLEVNDTETGEFACFVRKHHLGDPRLGQLIYLFARSVDDEAREIAREIADQHPDRKIRGQASFTIGRHAKWEIVRDAFPRDKNHRPLSEDKRKALQSDAEIYLTCAAKQYADVPLLDGNGTVGAGAEADLAGLANVPNLRPGKPAPDIVGEDLEGAKLTLKDFKGKVVLLVFWASWCGPCMADVPHERELVEKLHGRPFALVGVNGDENREKAKAAILRAQITWRSFGSNAGGRQGLIASAWNVQAWPTTYIIDHVGVIKHVNLRGKQLDEALEPLVAEAEVAAKGGRP